VREAVESYLRQDYPADLCELIVLDDVGQYENGTFTDEATGKQWTVVGVKRRFATVGEKRNACAGLRSPKADVMCVWDDDDIYFPDTLRSQARALETSDWARPKMVFVQGPGETLRRRHTQGIYHAAWAFTVKAFRKARGYPSQNAGHDQVFASRLRQAGYTGPLFDCEPYFLMRWKTGSYHLSGGRTVPAASGDFTGPIRPTWHKEYDKLDIWGVTQKSHQIAHQVVHQVLHRVEAKG
jgi:hypothetical protein